MDQRDELQIKIDAAVAALPPSTQSAINAVDWRAEIMSIRNNEGYDFIQLGELETETELLLCGLARPENYQRELESRMGISRSEADKLVAQMNERVFKKIKEELIKQSERQKIYDERKKEKEEQLPKKEPAAKPIAENEKKILSAAGIELFPEELLPSGNGSAVPEQREEILKKVENPPATPAAILATKLSAPTQTQKVETEHTLDNLTKPTATKNYQKGQDPYREPPI